MSMDMDSDDDSDDEDDNDDDGEPKTEGFCTPPHKQVRFQEPPATDMDSGRRRTRSASRVVDSEPPRTTASMMKQLAQDTKKSKDKLFFIMRQRPSHKLNSWHLVQVDEEENELEKGTVRGVLPHSVLYQVLCRL